MAEDFTQDQLTRSYAEAAELDARAAEVLGAAEVTDAAANPCDVWRRIRPLVEAASNLFFIPPNIRALLKQVIRLVDAFCPPR